MARAPCKVLLLSRSNEGGKEALLPSSAHAASNSGSRFRALEGETSFLRCTRCSVAGSFESNRKRTVGPACRRPSQRAQFVDERGRQNTHLDRTISAVVTLRSGILLPSSSSVQILAPIETHTLSVVSAPIFNSMFAWSTTIENLS